MRIRLNIRQAKKRTPFADRIYNVKKLSTLSLSTVMLIVSVGCKAAKPDQTRSAVPTLLSFTTPNEPLSFWSKDDRNRSTPYVLWVTLGEEKTCHLPIYRTGYTTSFGFISDTAKLNGIEDVEIGHCPNIQDRCFLKSADWTGPGLNEDVILEDQACDPLLIPESK